MDSGRHSHVRWGEIRCSAQPPAQLKPVSPKSPVSFFELSGMSLFKGNFHFSWRCICAEFVSVFPLRTALNWHTMPKHTHGDVHKHAHTCDSGVSQIKRMCVCVWSHCRGYKAFSGECRPVVCLSGTFGKKTYLPPFFSCFLVHC